MKKIVLNINQYNHQVSFDMLFVLTQFFTEGKLINNKIINVEHIAFDDEFVFFETDASHPVDLLGKTITQNGFDKAPIIIALNSNALFTENVEIPKLSVKEEKKAIQIELERLYEDYQDRYVYVQKGSFVNKQLRQVKTYFYNKNHYAEILHLIKRLKHPLSRVVLTPHMLAQAIQTNRLCDLTQPFIFVNVSELFTDILVMNKGLQTYHLVNQGIMSQKDMEAMEYYKYESNVIKTLASEIKRVMYNSQNAEIKNIYLNVENEGNGNGVDLLSSYLMLEVKKPQNKNNILENFNLLSALQVPKVSCPVFPTRISIKQKTKKDE